MMASSEEHTRAEIPRTYIEGLPIARVTRSELIEHIESEIAHDRGGWVVTAHLDYLQRHATDPAAAALIHQSDMIVADGMPLLWLARLQGTPLPDRVAGSDLVWLIAEAASRKGESIFLLGGAPGTAATTAAIFRERWPALQIAGVSCPEISSVPTESEIALLRESLEDANPDIVYVALGSPKQDLVIDALRAAFPRTWWIGVGVSFSFVSQEIGRAPMWMQRLGLEWLHRMAQEPLRLGHRYLVRNLPFAITLLARSLVTRLTADSPNSATPA